MGKTVQRAAGNYRRQCDRGKGDSPVSTQPNPRNLAITPGVETEGTHVQRVTVNYAFGDVNKKDWMRKDVIRIGNGGGTRGYCETGGPE